MSQLGWVVSAISGWSSRTSRAGPHADSSRSHIGITRSALPTSDEQRRVPLIASSAKAFRSAGAPRSGIRLAPAKHRDSSGPRRVHSSPPIEWASMPWSATRAATMHEPIGSSFSTRQTAAASRTTDTRRSPTRRKIGGADIWRTLCAANCGTSKTTDGRGPLSAYGHNRRTARFLSRTMIGAHLRREPHGLLDQRLDDLGLGHGLDDLATNED